MTKKTMGFVCSTLCAILLASCFSDVSAFKSNHKTSSSSRSSSHSYPSHHGNSGSHQNSHVSHSYPSSHGGLSGTHTSNSHSYPTGNGLSGSHINSVSHGSHTYPSSGSRSGSASYPASNGLSGNKASGTHYPNTGSYYPSGGSYPHNNYQSNVHHSNNWGYRPVHHTNSYKEVHHHYTYSPPTVIHYHSPYSSYGSAVSYPVYRGTLPPYVYEYRSSGNKYSYLLAGLALYNLGRMSGNSHTNSYHRNYIPQPQEHCKFGVHYRSGNSEEMAIDCRAITYFIYEMNNQPQTNQISTMTQNVVTTNVVQNPVIGSDGRLIAPANVNTQVLPGNGVASNTQILSANGVVVNNAQIPSGNGFVAPNTQTLSGNGAVVSNNQVLPGNGYVVPNTQISGNGGISNTHQVTTTTTQVVSVSDPRFYGQPVKPNADMECYVVRTTPISNTKKAVPCDLLETYAVQSLHGSAATVKSSLTVFVMVVAAFVIH